jgi:predicted unusual protein kinase regulating ubiquinone biosynthesis (AarF/ABC1/UbiB family)
MAAGAKAAGHAVGTLFATEEDRGDRLKALLASQMELLTREMGNLKGSVMKVGQLLSMLGEHILPPEANAFLKTLQTDSPPLEWPAVERQLRRQLGPEKLALLEVDPAPFGAASLGQVHRAKVRSTGEELALKIQYPGVDESVESDLNALKRLLSVAKLLPKGADYEPLFKEVREMLHREVDYERERESTDEFRTRLSDDPAFVVPRTFPEFSSRRVLATSFEPGLALDSPEVLALSQERRNALGRAFAGLYFRELFEFRAMQTDPHFGNYRVRLGQEGRPDQLVLYDFGAIRKIPQDFLAKYIPMVRGTYLFNRELVIEGGLKMGFLKEDDSEELLETFYYLCALFGEPFDRAFQPYDWGASDLPKRVIGAGKKMAFEFHLRAPPREVVFLDRKMGGVFITLSRLGVKADLRDLLERYL